LHANGNTTYLLAQLLLIFVAIPVQFLDAYCINSILRLFIHQVLDDQVQIVDALSEVELALVAAHDISSLVSQATARKTNRWYILDALES
jgi:hypothetical protein